MTEREYYRQLGRQIRQARSRAGLTQQELGDEVNLSRTSITNIESGNQPVTAWLLQMAADVLGCDLTTLLPTSADSQRSRVPNDVPPQTAALIERLATAR